MTAAAVVVVIALLVVEWESEKEGVGMMVKRDKRRDKKEAVLNRRL